VYTSNNTNNNTTLIIDIVERSVHFFYRNGNGGFFQSCIVKIDFYYKYIYTLDFACLDNYMHAPLAFSLLHTPRFCSIMMVGVRCLFFFFNYINMCGVSSYVMKRNDNNIF
jgi:hypothetical protein